MINLAIQFSNSKNLTNKGVQKAIDEIDKRKKLHLASILFFFLTFTSFL